ncbi:Ribbon-helix-helix protein, copG family [Ekhidna lutea]|uniref:Ribbon-helix-helix protein, copG family n=1 Tax=Ekhidna lutea TaxID=447679 RepID=A0A239KHS7_EKHLU|nr:ribbon-helix-helix domain-containing protein [Ekhidna lutea]SNT17159.1 Ribbon-helix-helix protein, copG family [Ekhidna lutea]
MNLSIYLPNGLKEQFEAYVKSKGISRSAAFRNAIELLLKQDKNTSWGTWIDKFESDQSIEPFEKFRDELKPPNQDIF